MREYLSSKDFSINSTYSLLPIEKSTLIFFFKKHLGTRDPVGSKVAPPLKTIVKG